MNMLMKTAVRDAMGWMTTCLRCKACGHTWVAVYPAETLISILECSVCHECAAEPVTAAQFKADRR